MDALRIINGFHVEPLTRAQALRSRISEGIGKVLGFAAAAWVISIIALGLFAEAYDMWLVLQ